MQQQAQAQPSASHLQINPILLPYCREKKFNNITAPQSSKPHVRNLKKISFFEEDDRFLPWCNSLISFTKTFKTQKSLSNLQQLFTSRFEFNNALFSKDLRGILSLSSLQITVWEESVNSTYLQTFTKTIASFKNLTHLDVTIFVYPAKRSPAIENLFNSLVKLPKLISLSLHASLFNPRGGEFDLLIKRLHRVTKLRRLKLRLANGMDPDERSLITILPSVLAKLTNLTHFELVPSGKPIQASALLALFKFFGTMKTLSSLAVDLWWNNIINENGTEVLAECLGCLDASRIQKLNLAVPATSQEKLPQALMRFSSLSVFALSFRGQKVMSDETIEQISSLLKSLTKLKSLNFTFPALENEILFDSIVSGIASLQNLTCLQLIFDRLVRISGKQVQKLFSSLKPSLKFLNISISEPKSVVDLDESYEELGQSLKRLFHLKNLSLNFGKNSIIKDAEISSIIDAINELVGLSYLELRLEGLDDVDESVIEKLAKTLRCLPSLSSVCFQLNGCKKLMEKQGGLLSLFSVLKEERSIVEIKLLLSHSIKNQEKTSELWKLKDVKINWY